MRSLPQKSDLENGTTGGRSRDWNRLHTTADVTEGDDSPAGAEEVDLVVMKVTEGDDSPADTEEINAELAERSPWRSWRSWRASTPPRTPRRPSNAEEVDEAVVTS